MLRILFLSFCLLISSFSTQAAGITIVGDINEPPRIYLDDGIERGFLVDILHYVEENSDLNFNIYLYPWARAYSTAEKGNAGIIGFSKTKEREAQFDYTIPVYFEDLLVVSTASNKVDFKNIEDLNGKIVGVTRGSVYGDEFEKARQEGKFIIFESHDSAHRLNLLIRNRIDVALIGSGKAGFNNALKADPSLNLKESDFHISSTPLVRDPNYIGFAKSMKAETLIEIINTVIREGYESGEIQEILQ